MRGKSGVRLDDEHRGRGSRPAAVKLLDRRTGVQRQADEAVARRTADAAVAHDARRRRASAISEKRRKSAGTKLDVVAGVEEERARPGPKKPLRSLTPRLVNSG